MYCNYAFYFGATADNADDLASLEDWKDAVVLNFAGSSTGNLLVAGRWYGHFKMHRKSLQFIQRMKQLKVNKKLIKNGDVHSHQYGEV